MKQVPAASAAGISQPGLSRIERGGLVPSPETVEILARVYRADPGTTAQLVELATAIRPEHLDSRIIMQRGLNHFQERLGKIERSSDLIRAYQPNIILGMLQTSDYAEWCSRPEGAPRFKPLMVWSVDVLGRQLWRIPAGTGC